MIGWVSPTHPRRDVRAGLDVPIARADDREPLDDPSGVAKGEQVAAVWGGRAVDARAERVPFAADRKRAGVDVADGRVRHRRSGCEAVSNDEEENRTATAEAAPRLLAL
jgi:hypothetical protein